jgi:glycosyltransferase involved in cell wall biosynthesis
MRILYASGNILVSSSTGGGAATQIIGFIRGMENAGHEVVMDLSGEQKLYPAIRTRGWLSWIRKNIPLSWLGYEVLQVLNNRKIYRRLSELDLSKFDLVWQRYELFTTAYVEKTKSVGLPSVFFVDAPLIQERETYSYLWLKHHAIECLKRNVEGSDIIIAVSEGIAKHIREQTKSPDLKIHVIPNGFSTHILDADKQAIENIKQQHFASFRGMIIGFVGSPKAWHRVDYLVRIAHRLSHQRDDFRILIVGDGPDLPAEMKLVDELGLGDFVKFTGQIKFEEIAPYLHAIDIGVMPDSNLYGSPMKITEYMACGAVVVAPDLPPIADLCTEGVDCLLFPKDDVEAMYLRIRQLLDSRELLEKLKQNAKTRALESYSWNARVEQIEEILKSEGKTAIRAHDTLMAGVDL